MGEVRRQPPISLGLTNLGNPHAVDSIQRRPGVALPHAGSSLGAARLLQAQTPLGATFAPVFGGPMRDVIQPKGNKKKSISKDDNKERLKKLEADKQKAQKAAQDKKDADRRQKEKEATDKGKEKQERIAKQKERQEKNQQELVNRPIEVSEENKLRLLVAGVDFRRLETVARLLETPGNICVAVARGEDGKIYATTNKGKLNSLVYQDKTKTLWVGKEVHATLMGENDLKQRAQKVSAYIDAKSIAEQINDIEHVRDAIGNKIHAEMKMLDFIVRGLELKTETNIYISKVCCANCSRALNFWNAKSKTPKIIYRHQSSGSEWTGWKCPPCIDEKELDEWLKSRGQERGRVTSRTDLSTRRERSPTPAPHWAHAKFGTADSRDDFVDEEEV
jgi:hypothetical protein